MIFNSFAIFSMYSTNFERCGLRNDPLKSERKPIFYVELSFISGSIFNSVRFMLLAIAPACENLMTDNNSGGNFQGREKFSTNVRCL